MTEVLLDTGLLIQFLRGNPKAAGFLALLLSQTVVSVSVISVTEILAGSRDEHHLTAAQSVLGLVQVLPIDRDIAEKAATLIKQYPPVFGTRISRGVADAYIAATAWSKNLPLYTLNTRDFAKISIAQIKVHAIDQNAPQWA